MGSEAALNQSADPIAPRERRNIVQFLLSQCDTPDLAGRVALKHKREGQWHEMIWAELLLRVRRLSEALVAQGLLPGDRVAIYASSRYEWVLADLAILGAGAITVPIYPTNAPHEVEHILKESEARWVFFDEERRSGSARREQLAALRSQLPALRGCIAIDGAREGDASFAGFETFEQEGEAPLALHPRALEARAAAIGWDDLSTILYTSGTTGMPKGVMQTHGNWGHLAWAINQLDIITRQDVILLFLPLAHAFARVAEMAWLRQGSVMVFAESIEKAVDNMAEVGATVFPSVPRVYEKAYAKVMEEGNARKGLEGILFRWAMERFEAFVADEEAGRTPSFAWKVAKATVFRKLGSSLMARFGGKLRLAVSGGAPLSSKIARFLQQCEVPVVEGYGLTETCAPTHANHPGASVPGAVGYPFPGLEAKIAEDGELLLRGPQVMKGYYKMPLETAEVLDADGWFKTGDIGEIAPDGLLRITDRKKDLIKTSGGKYIAPQALENALKSEPLISQTAILGDRRNFVSALITLSEENLLKWARDARIVTKDYKRLLDLPEVRDRIQSAIDAVNQGLPRYATIKKFAILDRDWSTLTGELTPKLSVRRKVIEAKFKKVIDDLYGSERDGERPR